MRMRAVSFVHAFSFVLAAALASACTEVKSPNAPSDLPQAPPAQSIANTAAVGSVAPPAFPAVSRPARVYVATYSPVYAMHGSPLMSRYLLYNDGTFALQYASANYPFFEYLGTYVEMGAHVTFLWGSCCERATATLIGDELAVEYSDMMQHSDFVNGVYVRAK